MDKILIFDTSRSIFSATLFDIQNETYVEVVKSASLQHAKHITTATQKLLKKMDATASDIVAVAINAGPGSFTGLRVGSSAAKGFCFGLDVPLISLSGIKQYALFFSKKQQNIIKNVIVTTDARNGYYFCSYIKDGEATEVEKLHNDEIDKIVKKHNIEQRLYDSDLFSHQLVNATKRKWHQAKFENIETFEPHYLVNNYVKK